MFTLTLMSDWLLRKTQNCKVFYGWSNVIKFNEMFYAFNEIIILIQRVIYIFNEVIILFNELFT